MNDALAEEAIMRCAAILAASIWVPLSAMGGPPCLPVQSGILEAPNAGSSSNSFSWTAAVSGTTLIAHDFKSGGGTLHTYDRSGDEWVLVNAVPFPLATTAIDGTRAIAGLMNSVSPKLRVLQRSGVGWTVQQELYPDPPGPSSQFAQAVAISGDTVLASSPYQSVGGFAGAGAVHVYANTGGVWAFEQLLSAAPGSNGAKFGWSIVTDGDTIVAGAVTHTVGSLEAAGAAYIFERIAGQWTQVRYLTAPIPAAYRGFGISVAVSGNTILVGEAPNDGFYPPYQGAAYVYVRNAGSWMLQGKLTASDPGPNDRFGHAVALEGDTALISGWLNGTGVITTAPGAVYLFRRSGSAWTQDAKLVGVNSLGYKNFGVSVVMSDGHALIGARRPAGSFSQGCMFAFRLGCPPSCYADCSDDGSLSFADFTCFLTAFELGDLYADCNADASLTVADFGCFQTKYVLGCP